MRARAFHILEPRGTVDMLTIFLEERSEGSPPLLDSSKVSLTETCEAFFFFLFLCVHACVFVSTADLHTRKVKLVHIYIVALSSTNFTAA